MSQRDIPYEETLGYRIRHLRERLGMSGEKFGQACGGVTKGNVSGWESNLHKPSLDALITLHNKYPFSYDWLIAGRGSEAIVLAEKILAMPQQHRDVLMDIFSRPAVQDDDDRLKGWDASKYKERRQEERRQEDQGAPDGERRELIGGYSPPAPHHAATGRSAKVKRPRRKK